MGRTIRAALQPSPCLCSHYLPGVHSTRRLYGHHVIAEDTQGHECGGTRHAKHGASTLLISQLLNAFQQLLAFQTHTAQLFSVGSYTPASCALEHTTEGSINQAAWPKAFRRLGLKGPPWKSLRPTSSLGKQAKRRPVTSQTGSDSQDLTHTAGVAAWGLDARSPRWDIYWHGLCGGGG